MRFGARDYDPQTGRWTAKDPIKFAGGSRNLYGYVYANPVNRLDVAGLSDAGIGYASITDPSTGQVLQVPAVVAADVYQSLQAGTTLGEFTTTTTSEAVTALGALSVVTGLGAIVTSSGYLGTASLACTGLAAVASPTQSNIEALALGAISKGVVAPLLGDSAASAVDAYGLIAQTGGLAGE